MKMVIFHSCVSLPEGNQKFGAVLQLKIVVWDFKTYLTLSNRQRDRLVLPYHLGVNRGLYHEQWYSLRCYDINTGAWHCIAKTEHWGFMPAFVFAIMNRYTSGNRHLFGKSISLRCRSFADDGLSIARFVYCRNLLEIEWITSRLECICKAVLSNLFMKVKLEIPVESFSDVNIWVLICEM